MRNCITIDHRRIGDSFNLSILLASAAYNLSRLFSKRVLGHTSIIRLMVCSLEHSQFCVSVMLHSCSRHWHSRYWHLPSAVLIQFEVFVYCVIIIIYNEGGKNTYGIYTALFGRYVVIRDIVSIHARSAVVYMEW